MVWTFDTSATHHITADYSCLQDPTLDTTSIKVGGGRVPHATYKGTVRLVVEGTGILFSLSDVLFIPGWSETSLISWRKIAPKCRMTGEDDWISVSLKNGNPVFSACPNLYELPVTSKQRHKCRHWRKCRHWHKRRHRSLISNEALGHSSVNTWKDTTDRYIDGKLIPS